MSGTPYDYAFGISNPSASAFIQNQYPNLTLSGTETNGANSQVVEVGGSTWLVTNALYNPVFAGFVQQNAALPSTAIVTNRAGYVQLATAPATAATPISWSFATIQSALPSLPYEYYFIDYYGADPTGAGYSDSAFAAALAAIASSSTQRGRIIMGAGTYKISSAVTLPSNVYVEGEGIGTTTLTQTTLTAAHFTATNANYVGVSRATLTYASASSSGQSLAFSSCTFVHIDQLFQTNWGYAIHLYNTSNIYVTNVNGIGTTSSVDGFYVTATDAIGFNSNDIHLSNSRFGGATNGAPISGAAYHLNGCAAVWMTSCDSFNAHDNMLMDPGSGQLVSNLFIDNCSFDYATRHSFTVLPNGGSVILISLDNCWTSGGAIDGLHIESTNGAIDQFQVANLRANNCGGSGNGYGINIVGKVVTGQTNLTNVSITNPMTLVNNTGGISVSNASQITVVGGTNGNSSSYSNPPYTSQQKYAINLTGTNNNVLFLGHTYLSTNALGALTPATTTTGAFFVSCPGINVPSQTYTFMQAFGVSAPTSTTAYQNNTGHVLRLYISGGTVTGVNIGNVVTGLTSGSFRLGVQEFLYITFSSAPTITIGVE